MNYPLIAQYLLLSELTFGVIVLIFWGVIDSFEKHPMFLVEFIGFLVYLFLFLTVKHQFYTVSPRLTLVSLVTGSIGGGIVFLRWLRKQR